MVCKWTKEDFMNKSMTLVRNHLKTCRDCNSVGHLILRRSKKRQRRLPSPTDRFYYREWLNFKKESSKERI